MIYATYFNQSLNDIHINLLLIIKIREDNRSFALKVLKIC
jgi:hypothetical protein